MFRRSCTDIIQNLDTALRMMEGTQAEGTDPFKRSTKLHRSILNQQNSLHELGHGLASRPLATDGEYSYLSPLDGEQNLETDRGLEPAMWLLDPQGTRKEDGGAHGFTVGSLGGRSHPSGAFPKTVSNSVQRSSTPANPDLQGQATGVPPVRIAQPGRNIQNQDRLQPRPDARDKEVQLLNEQLEAGRSEIQGLQLKASSQKVQPRAYAPVVKAPMTMKLPYNLTMFSGTGDTDWPDWIRIFERTTKACQVRGKPLLDSLEAYLDGPALHELISLIPPAQDYETAKAHLTKVFQSSGQARRAALILMNRTQKDGESILEYSTALVKLAKTAYPTKTCTEIDFLLSDRFTSGIQASYIKVCDFDLTQSFREAVHLAKRCEDRMLAAADEAVNKPSPEPKPDTAGNLVLSSLSLATGLDAFKTEILNSV